jgi:hypothetical protein
VDAIGHSEGAINLLLAASMCPMYFRSIILVGPAGLLKRDRFWSLVWRLLSKTWRSIKTAMRHRDQRRSILVGILEGNLYFLANPVRAVKEGYAISHSRTEGLIRQVRKNGVKVVVVSGVDDQVFPMEHLQGCRLELDGFVSVRGVHDDLYFQSERYMPAIISLLNSLSRS